MSGFAFRRALYKACHDSVVYTVSTYAGFKRRHQDVFPTSHAHEKTLRRLFDLFNYFDKEGVSFHWKHFNLHKTRIPGYEKKNITEFVDDLDRLYMMGLLHIHSKSEYAKAREASFENSNIITQSWRNKDADLACPKCGFFFESPAPRKLATFCPHCEEEITPVVPTK